VLLIEVDDRTLKNCIREKPITEAYLKHYEKARIVLPWLTDERLRYTKELMELRLKIGLQLGLDYANDFEEIKPQISSYKITVS
jgi:hypothetical protein